MQFAEMNLTAVRKILKKFDKEVMRRPHLRERLFENSTTQNFVEELIATGEQELPHLQDTVCGSLKETRVGTSRERLGPLLKLIMKVAKKYLLNNPDNTRVIKDKTKQALTPVEHESRSGNMKKKKKNIFINI